MREKRAALVLDMMNMMTPQNIRIEIPNTLIYALHSSTKVIQWAAAYVNLELIREV